MNFPVDKLVSRRSFVFARAGFGKSNLTKLLFSSLYETTPTVDEASGTPSAGGNGDLRPRRRVLLARRQGTARLLRCRGHGRPLGRVHVTRGAEPLLRVVHGRAEYCSTSVACPPPMWWEPSCRLNASNSRTSSRCVASTAQSWRQLGRPGAQGRQRRGTRRDQAATET